MGVGERGGGGWESWGEGGAGSGSGSGSAGAVR